MEQIKIFSMMISCFLIIGLLFSFAGCDVSPNKKISYAVTYTESGSGGEAVYGCDKYSGVTIDENTIKLCNSRQELLDFSDENGFSFFEVKGEDFYHIKQRIYDSDLSQKIRSYDESFFNDKSLVLIFVMFENVYPAKIDTVAIEAEALAIKVAIPDEDSFLDAVSYHTFIIEVAKNSVQNKSAKLSVIRKGSAKDYLDENEKYKWKV